MEDRHELKSTIVPSQLPVKNWHAVMKDPTLADAILDRMVHNAYKIALTRESMRKENKPLPKYEILSVIKTPASLMLR